MSDMREKIAEAIWDVCDEGTFEHSVNSGDVVEQMADAILAALPGMIPELEFAKNNHGQRWARQGPLSYGYWKRPDGSWYVMSNNDSNLCGDEEAAILWANTTHRQQLMKALGLA